MIVGAQYFAPINMESRHGAIVQDGGQRTFEDLKIQKFDDKKITIYPLKSMN